MAGEVKSANFSSAVDASLISRTVSPLFIYVTPFSVFIGILGASPITLSTNHPNSIHLVPPRANRPRVEMY